MFYLRLSLKSNEIKLLKAVTGSVIPFDFARKNSKHRVEDVRDPQVNFKQIFIFDLNHEILEVNIMGDNSLLFIKLFEESIKKSVKCCMKSLWPARII